MAAEQHYDVTDAPRPETTMIHLVPAVNDCKVRCWRCRQLLAEHLTRPWQITCRRCHATNASAPGFDNGAHSP